MALRLLSKIPVDDDRVNRWQDHVISVLNPALRSLFTASTPTSARPIANEDTAGRLIRVKDPGVPERLQVCLQCSDGGWAWCDVALAPR